MRRFITYINSLLLGVILGMIFVAIVHAAPPDRQHKVHANESALLRFVLHRRNTQPAE
ncbi:MAG: hypothetical protein WBQ95_00940 [Terracidiphilus sp.]